MFSYWIDPRIRPICRHRTHVWDALDRRIRARVPVPYNVRQLRIALQQEWINIPQATIDTLVNFMRRRYVALRDARGGHTRY